MVKYRRRQFRRRGRKTPWYNRKYNAMQVASAAWRGVKYIKGLVNSEMYHYTQTATSTPLATGDIIPLTNIAVGDTDVTRTGNSIFVRSITMNFNCSQHPARTDNTFVRMILFIDTQQISDTNPTLTDILASQNPNSLLKLQNSGRFKILKNWEFYINSVNNTGKVIKYYRNIKHHVRYNDVNSTDIQKGGIYLLIVSNVTPVQNQPPTLQYQIRVGYHDN